MELLLSSMQSITLSVLGTTVIGISKIRQNNTILQFMEPFLIHSVKTRIYMKFKIYLYSLETENDNHY
jgi:hypothetical protein